MKKILAVVCMLDLCMGIIYNWNGDIIEGIYWILLAIFMLILMKL